MAGDFTAPQAQILIVDDSEADAELFRIAFSKAEFDADIDHVLNGEIALDFLHRRPPYESKKLPDLIFLDLNMPMISGHEVLKIIRLEPAVSDIPIIVSSVSTNPFDVEECFDLEADAYISKSFSFDDIIAMVENLKQCWQQTGDAWRFVGIHFLSDCDPAQEIQKRAKQDNLAQNR